MLQSLITRYKAADASNFYLALANFASLVLSVINFKFLAGHMTKDALASYILVITFQSFSMMTLTSPLRIGLVRLYATALIKNDQAGYLRFAIVTLLVSGLIATIAGCAVSMVLGHKHSLDTLAVIFALVYGLLLDFTDFLAGTALQKGNKGLAAIRTVIGKFSLTVGLLLAVLFFKTGTPATILGLTLLAHILLTALSIQWRMNIPRETNENNWRQWFHDVLAFSWIFAATGVISWAQVGMPRFFLSWWQNQESIAQYFIVTQIASLSMMGIAATVSQAIAPRLFRRHDEDPEAIQSPWQSELVGGVLLILCFALGGFVLSMVAGDHVIRVISQDRYAHLSLLMALSFVTCGIYMSAQFLRMYGDQNKKPSIYLATNIVYPILTVLLVLAAARISITAVCVVTCLAEVLHLLLVAATNQWYFSKKRKNRWLSLKFQS